MNIFYLKRDLPNANLLTGVAEIEIVSYQPKVSKDSNQLRFMLVGKDGSHALLFYGIEVQF